MNNSKISFASNSDFNDSVYSKRQLSTDKSNSSLGDDIRDFKTDIDNELKQIKAGNYIRKW